MLELSGEVNISPKLNEKNRPPVLRFVPGDGCFLRVSEGVFSGC